MKKPFNLRLKQSTVILLDNLSQELGLNKTAIIEQSLQLYNKQKTSSKKPKNKLLKYAGAIKDWDVDEFLKTIYSSRVNKDIDIKF